MGDNPTAGGAGDVTWTLNEILNNKRFKKNGPELIYASIPGPDLVTKALEAGIGNVAEGYVGGIVDNRYSPSIKLKEFSNQTPKMRTIVKQEKFMKLISLN